MTWAYSAISLSSSPCHQPVHLHLRNCGSLREGTKDAETEHWREGGREGGREGMWYGRDLTTAASMSSALPAASVPASPAAKRELVPRRLCPLAVPVDS